MNTPETNTEFKAEAKSTGYQFGTFKGVFTPSILTILGVIMYLRLGWVVGNVGLGGALFIITMACAITFLTGLALAALATNMRIRLGGAYYIISRSLGIEFGAGIGIPLYFAQAIGIAFYISGFAESVITVFPGVNVKLVAVATLAVLAALAFFSADLSLRFQYVVMALIFVSLLSFFLGATETFQPVAETPALFKSWPFWAVFAVFFPAVTGIEAGLSMSGDLKNPARALPLGTIAAVLCGFIVYIGIALALYFHGVDRTTLVENPAIMHTVSRWPALLTAGIWAASLSSAMGSLLGAPRTMQALSRDKVLFRFLGRGHGKGDDPRIATLISTGIALVAVLAGDLNVIAPVLSMFFLTSYGFLNLSAGLEELISPASWRPRFHVKAIYPILGFCLCLAAMLMINAGATMTACIAVAFIYYIVKRRKIKAGWGDMRRGIMASTIRILLYKMARQKPNVKTWQPNTLVLSGVPTQRWHLIELASLLSAGRGFMTVAAVIAQNGNERERLWKYKKSIEQHLERRGVDSLVCVYPCDDPLIGARHLVMAYGMGPLVPNTIMIGDSKDIDASANFANIIRAAYQTRKNVVIVREEEMEADGTSPDENIPAETRRVDVWWGAKSSNISLMLTLAVLMARNTDSKKTVVTVKMVAENEADKPGVESNIKAFLKKERLNLETEVLLRNDRPIFELIADASAETDLVFLGLRAPRTDENAEEYGLYLKKLMSQTSGLPMTALVLAGEDVDFAALFASGNDEK